MKTLTLNLLLLLILFQSSAQSNLTLNCEQDPNDYSYNQISLDGNLVEYGLCGLTPSFYISIIDTNCMSWGTKFTQTNQNVNNGFGNYNDNGYCRPRVEHFFVYRQTDSIELVYMDSLLNYWIPDDHVIAIWTPISFNFNSVSNLCPSLGNTLINKWGNDVQTNSMVVLFGEQGNQSSFSVDTLIVGTTISVTKTICPYSNSNLGLNEFNNSTNKSLIRIVDLLGREAEKKTNTILLYIYSDGTTEKVFKIE